MVETTDRIGIARLRLAEGAVVAAAFGALALVVLAAAGFGGVMLPWLANAFLLARMCSHQRADAWWWLATCLLVDLGARAATGATLPLAATLAGADLLEVAVAWFGLSRLRDTEPPSERALPAVVGIALVLAPLLGTALAVAGLHWLGGRPWNAGFTQWWPAHVLGLLALAPVVFAWGRGQARHAFAATAFWSFLLLVLVACFAVVLSPLAPVLVALVLLLAACRLGLAEVVVLDLIAVVGVMLVATVFVHRPPLLALLGTPGLELGLATAVGTLAPLLVGLLASQRDAATARASLVGERMQLLADHAPGLVAQLGRDLRYRFVNRAWLQWHGRREDEVLGRTPRELFDEGLVSRFSSRMNRALAGQSQQFDVQMPDGRELKARYEPQFGADGAVEGFYLLAEDVSWRGQAGLRFQSLLESADALLLVDQTGKVTQANAAASRLFGVDAAALQRPAGELLSEHSREAFAAALRTLHQGGEQETVLALSGRRGERDFPIEVRLSNLPAAGHSLAAVAVRDLEETTGLAQALHREQAIANATLGAIGDAVVACDAARRITLFNPIAEDLTGWTREEAVGQPLENVIRMMGQESGEATASPLDMALREGRAVGLTPDSALLRRDGARAPIEASALPVHDADGGLVGGVMVFHDVSETRAMAMKMSHLAQHDYLTDLPNRVLLHDRLSQALAASERGSKGALLFVDLDFFKHINDTLGHQAGDKVLQEVARRLVNAVRVDDTVSRQGGDEFVLLLVRLADPRDAARVAEKLILAIEEPFHVEGQVLRISASVGIALFPQDARDIKTLMKQADTALYHAKEAGRGRYSYFTGVMSEKAEQRMRIEHDLRLALANNDFFLVYQPKVLLPQGRITGMEALVRWRRCDTGEVVAPGEFIPVAEETGLIVELDEWVMREACRQNQAWQDAGLGPVPVSVNVSLARFDPDRLIGNVRRTLAMTGMAPECLEIEFTESQMFTHLEHAQQLIAQLKELGVQVAVDDFGTGYSSLGYLVRYKFDALKIDRSFVHGLPDDPKHSAIVQAIVGMAHALDYRVVAEGVENNAQAEALQRLGCHEMQGFLYSCPLPAEEFAMLLRRGHVPGAESVTASREA